MASDTPFAETDIGFNINNIKNPNTIILTFCNPLLLFIPSPSRFIIHKFTNNSFLRVQKNPGNLTVPGYLTLGHNVPYGTQYILISDYSMMVATRPDPTVRPPSRIAKVRPCSIAIGWISSMVISTLSPGMHISVPSGRLITPVTSVVRK